MITREIIFKRDVSIFQGTSSFILVLMLCSVPFFGSSLLFTASYSSLEVVLLFLRSGFLGLWAGHHWEKVAYAIEIIGAHFT
jgi:hypothetical protein